MSIKNGPLNNSGLQQSPNEITGHYEVVPIKVGTVTVENWRDLAVCKGETALFFPKQAERPQARQRREAEANEICQKCPVIDLCREEAIANGEYGFWGGTTEEERHINHGANIVHLAQRHRNTRKRLIAEGKIKISE